MPTRKTFALLAAAGVSLAAMLPATAQDTTQDLDLGEPVAEEEPRQYIKAVHNDWEVQCLRLSETEEFCQMYQVLTEPGGGNVAEVRIFRLDDGGPAIAGGAITAPLETLLTRQLTIAVDGGQPRRYDFAFCTMEGCVARIGFTQAEIDAFRAGAVAQVSIVPAVAPDQVVTVDMSLSGFTAAYAEVSAAP